MVRFVFSLFKLFPFKKIFFSKSRIHQLIVYFLKLFRHYSHSSNINNKDSMKVKVLQQCKTRKNVERCVIITE